jgi:hypothetical protein
MQGHPESPLLWEKHVNKILWDIDLTPTIHEPCLYSGIINGNRVLFMQQADNFDIATQMRTLWILEQCHILICVYDSQIKMLILSQITKKTKPVTNPHRSQILSVIFSRPTKRHNHTQTQTYSITDICSNNFHALLDHPCHWLLIARLDFRALATLALAVGCLHRS